MKHKTFAKITAWLMCFALLTACLPLTAFAAETTALSMTEGEVITGFCDAGTVFSSSDPAVAWVDESGCLNALKPGTATLSDGSAEYTVTVGDYADGSPVVGNLKLLARYNDSMQFYDGHVYLLFTSYQDGVEINVNDLYGAYEISPQYYTDIRKDISNGSNHTGKDADRYFTFTDDLTTMQLNRGELVTIGMYRDFDLSVPQAALGCIENSSAWNQLTVAGKGAVVENIFSFLQSGTISFDEAIEKIKAVCAEVGVDYTKALDGVVDGGVCFNRELYNQKLEWDQYENVTYDLDITENQLNILTAYLGGNLHNFSILKNSCATVALRAWNAAVGTRNGADTAYKLSSAGTGFLSFIDAPKGVRDSIVSRLPGYYRNNAAGVAEPGAGYQDDTGWVYVSAPKQVSPVAFRYLNADVQIDESMTDMTALVKLAKAGSRIAYNKDEQVIDVRINTSAQANAVSIDSIDFTINGQTVSVNRQTALENGIWFKLPSTTDGCFVTDAEGKALPSEYSDGLLRFYAEALPVVYQVVTDERGVRNQLKTVIVNDDSAATEVYYLNGTEKTALGSTAEVTAGTKIYIKPADLTETCNILRNITFNGESVFNDTHFDEREGAYCVTMPEKYALLTVTYEMANIFLDSKPTVQVSVGDELKVGDYASLYADGAKLSDRLTWKIIADPDGALELHDNQLKAVKKGAAVVWACAAANNNLYVPLTVKVYDTLASMAEITYDNDNIVITSTYNDTEEIIPYSGYLVEKGATLTVKPVQTDGTIPLYILCNLTLMTPNASYTVKDNTKVTAEFAAAAVEGVPSSVVLKAKGDTCQLNAKVTFTGIKKILPVIYDSSIRYESSDPLVKVDDNGLLTVAQEIPKSGKAVIVTAYACSGNNAVYARCKVIVGAYDGARIVGRLTVSARPIVQKQLVSHGMLTFTSYEDADMDISYYEYYKPNDKYNAFMVDYEVNPEKYTSDPALYSDNELRLENRDSYFDIISHGAESEPATVSLKAGESITISNYGFDTSNLSTFMKTIEDGSISYFSPEANVLVEQIKRYMAGEPIDDAASFDSLVSTLIQIYAISKIGGFNPADGHSEGGLAVNRELFNQFRRDDSQLPNHYYAVDITADELAVMKAYLVSPSNNYYSLMTMNCASGVVDIWNTVLADRNGLQLTANLTGLAVDPMSLYFELGMMQFKRGLDGESGNDFYARTVAYNDAEKDAISKIAAIGEAVLSADCKKKIDAAAAAYEGLNDVEKARIWNHAALTDAMQAYLDLAPLRGDVNGDGTVDVGDITELQRMTAEVTVMWEVFQTYADVDGNGAITIADATLLQQWLAEYDSKYPIGKPIC